MYYFYWSFLKELPKAALFLCFICIQLLAFLYLSCLNLSENLFLAPPSFCVIIRFIVGVLKNLLEPDEPDMNRYVY